MNFYCCWSKNFVKLHNSEAIFFVTTKISWTQNLKTGSSITPIKYFVSPIAQDDLTEKYQWRLGVVITDGTDNRIVQLSATLLESWIGFGPDQYKKFNANDKKRNEKILTDVSQKLVELNCLLKLQSINDEITVIDVLTPNKGHLQQLKNRCKDLE